MRQTLATGYNQYDYRNHGSFGGFVMAGKSSGGFKGALSTLMMIIIIAGVILGWMRVANINSVEDAWNYFRTLSDHINYNCMQGEAQWKCREGEDPNNPSSPPSDAKTMKPYDPRHPGYNGGSSEKGPKDDSDGSTGNTGNLDPNNQKDLRTILSNLPTMEEQDVDYDRKEWKHWTGSPCNVRIQVLQRDGENVKMDGCKVVSGTWLSKYDNETITDSRGIDIDHIIPLGYAAKHGGNDWSPEKKEQFANDMTQLVGVSAKSNRSKSDKGPSEWMPDRSYYCEYSKAWVTTADKYGLAISEADKGELLNGISKC